MELRQAVFVEILPTKLWIESGPCGERAVMMQHEGCEPFEYALFAYDYRYTCNSGTWAAADALARQLGANDPIEHRTRTWKMPTADDLRQRIAELTETLSKLEHGTPSESNDR